MKRFPGFITLFVATTTAPQEPKPRQLSALPIRLNAELATISGARELRDGRILLSDATRAAVLLADPKTGSAQQIGSAGGGQNQYAQPGGFYSGKADTVYLLDRAQSRFLVISPTGEIVGARSIKRRGVTGSSSADQDFQQLDVRGLSYFVERSHRFAAPGPDGLTSDTATLMRFEASSQHYDTLALLRLRDKKVTQVDERSTFSRAVHGSPEDGWGITPDGAVAVVRAAPYRVDWFSPSGRLTRGPVVSTHPIPYTDAEKAATIAASAKSGGGSVGASGVGGPQGSSPSPDQLHLFAPTKATFDPNGIIVSPNGEVWVARSRPATATTVLYDVFNKRGERTDRVEFPARSRVIGFGAKAVFVVERDERGTPLLRKYKL